MARAQPSLRWLAAALALTLAAEGRAAPSLFRAVRKLVGGSAELSLCRWPLVAPSVPSPAGSIPAWVTSAVRRASPRFLAISREMPYPPFGILLSEALALIAAIEETRATVLIESGTAPG